MVLLSLPADALGCDWALEHAHAGHRAPSAGPQGRALRILSDTSFSAAIERYRYPLMVLALMLALLLAHHWRVNRLLQKRKLAIKAEERPRSHAAEALRESREKLALVERAGMTSHLAAMFAHEIKQPLTSIVNYLTGIRLTMSSVTSTKRVVRSPERCKTGNSSGGLHHPARCATCSGRMRPTCAPST